MILSGIAILLTLLGWIAAVIGIVLLILLIVPIRIRARGLVDDQQGVDYHVGVDWGLGTVGITKYFSGPFRVLVFGIKVFSFMPEKKTKKKKEKKEKKKKFKIRGFVNWIRAHYTTLTGVLNRMIRAIFLRGYITARIGLPDPADTACFDLFFRMLNYSGDRFIMRGVCVYDEEVIHVNIKAQATLLLGYIGLVALGLLLRRQTRLMLRGFRHA